MNDEELVAMWERFKKDNPDDIFSKDALVPISTILDNETKPGRAGHLAGSALHSNKGPQVMDEPPPSNQPRCR